VSAVTAYDPAGFGMTQLMAQALRQFVLYVGWGVCAALLAAGLCWSCGCGAQAAWARIGPPRRVRPRDPVVREACRGVRELERYLAQAAAPAVQPRRPRRRPH
jgi:hypothetical protein